MDLGDEGLKVLAHLDDEGAARFEDKAPVRLPVGLEPLLRRVLPEFGHKGEALFREAVKTCRVSHGEIIA